ncbi:YcgN family cysteine cluster protein [Roseibium hamelinense]|nr:YcgN family cysteine cluster protein [Roseibium hamelinense]MTI42636.1 YcgN family cysteine cluster protein [Roseibium hamelinense]
MPTEGQTPLSSKASPSDPRPFWQRKSLAEMTGAEWESLCDGCARCCLNKLEDWDTGVVVWTDVACTLLDGETCRCTDYENRAATVPDCIQLTPEEVPKLGWLPPTCAYRLIEEGADLYWWHPLVSGDPQTVHQAGVSVTRRTVSEDGMDLEDYEDHVVSWPAEVPPQAR